MNLRIQKILAWPICLILLVGIIAAGNNYVLCINNDGDVKFETLCLPCCGEAENSCEVKLPNELQDELGDCYPCSDVEFDGSLWSRRIQNDYSNYLTNLTLAFNADGHLSPGFSEKSNLPILKFYPAYGQSPPYFSMALITTTVVRC